MCRIRALAADEWPLLRDLRLRALRDAPDAFGPTFEENAERPEAWWREGARRFADSEAADLLIAERDGQAVGLVSAVGREGEGGVGAMWVDPEARRAGVAGRLLARACEVLAGRGCTRITLKVTRTNDRAIALYASFGFVPTGEVHPLRDGSSLEEIEMALDVSKPDSA